jgi:hypothetical protein
MPSVSWQQWNATWAQDLDDIEAAHRSVGGIARGRRYATQQINHAYAVLLASKFQAFCRDLHSESVDFLVRAVSPAVLQSVLRAEFLLDRSLDRGNANPSTIGSDFNRLGVEFWKQVYSDHPRNDRRKEMLEELNRWRNAIAHQDFHPVGGSSILHLPRVKAWRKACNRLALSFDHVMHAHLAAIIGVSPW